MRKSFKILMILMVFAFIGVVNVKAACQSSEWYEGSTGYFNCGTPSGGNTAAPGASTPGTTYNQIVIDQTKCTACNNPCYAIRQWSKICTKCEAGEKLKTDGSGCDTCPANTYSANGISCTDCPSGQHSSAGASSCTPDKTTPTITVSGRTGSGAISHSVSPNIAGTWSFTSADTSIVTVDGNGNATCQNKPGTYNGKVTVSFTPSDTSRYNKPASKDAYVQCVYEQPADAVLTSVSSNQGTYYLKETSSISVPFYAKDKDGNPVKASWTASSNVASVSLNCSNTATCNVVVSGIQCGKSGNVTAVATAGEVQKSGSVTVVSYGDWNKVSDHAKAPSNAYTRAEMESRKGCKAYEKVDPSTGYGEEWDRCCGGSTPEEPACFNCSGTYKWGLPSDNTNCTLIASITDESKCKKPSTDTPACYKCGEELKWGKYASDTSCTFVSENQADCEEKPYCYKNVSTGEYDWGKHAGDSAWVKYSENEADCQKEPEEEDPACYTKNDEYYWGKYKDVAGYTFTSLTEAQCKKFCYKETATGEFVWGNHVGDDKYEIVASITDKNKCRAACFKCGEEVKWGSYFDDDKCEEDPGVTTIEDCKVTPPPTGLSVSNILYACGAFLVIMGSGIVVYQLTRVKKELD